MSKHYCDLHDVNSQNNVCSAGYYECNLKSGFGILQWGKTPEFKWNSTNIQKYLNYPWYTEL